MYLISNIFYDVLILIFNKLKDMFSFIEELWLILSSGECKDTFSPKEELLLNLPSDVWRLIFKKFKEKRVFAQICRSWCMIADDEIFWLLRSSGSKSIRLLQLDSRQSTIYIAKLGYDMFIENDKKIEERDLSFTHLQIQIIGSCRGGWILLLETTTADLKLWNPLFDVKIRLPYFPSPIIKAATFFRNDFGIGVAVISEDGKLAFIKHGDFKWSHLCGFETNKGQYEDLISSNDSILALSKNGESIHTWNFEGKNILNVKLDFPEDMKEIKDPENYKHKLYIAESKGRVFLVIRWLTRTFSFILGKNQTINFYLYFLDEGKREWSRLQSLGDESLFLGKNQTMLLHAKDFEECQQNSIYFAGHSLEKVPIENELNSYVTVFCMEDSRIQKCQYEFYNSLCSCWIVSGV